MVQRPTILLVDDDPDVLELYQERLSLLPSQPKVTTAASGAQAITLLESESFTLLLSDLNMPSMNGLEVLAFVRRKYPQMRTAVMTAVNDPQFRTRAYAMGLDIYLEKPSTPQAIQLFSDCIEALLGQESQVGFRGMQSKSLVDIIQLECFSQSSAVLHISSGFREGKIWFQNGEVIDAVTEGLAGEAAFRLILSWKTGKFELLPEEPNHSRSIFTSSQGLLLETAQAIDENLAMAGAETAVPQAATPEPAVTPASKIEEMGRHPGVEFVMAITTPEQAPQCWAVENPQFLAAWTSQTLNGFRTIGSQMGLGQSLDLLARGVQRHVAMSAGPSAQLCVGFERAQTKAEIQQTMLELKTKWAS